MKRTVIGYAVLIIVVMAVVCIWNQAAWADDDDEGDRNRSGNDCTEVEQGGQCEDNDLSPSFQDSPVDHSFNFGPVCVLPDSCRFEGQPAAFPPDAPPACPPVGVPPALPHCDRRPHSLFPPTPEKLIAFFETIFTSTQEFIFTIVKLAV